MLGQPQTNPWRVAFRSVDILGLHNDWCANMTELARVLMECENVVRSMRSELPTALEFLCGLPTFPLLSAVVELIGSIHRLVAGSLNPRIITCLLYITSHFGLVNSTEHPALHSISMPINDAIVNLGTICLVKIVGRPGIVMSHMCVDFTLLPSGKLIVNGCGNGRTLLAGVPSMINMEVALVSVIAWFILIAIVLRYCWLGEPNICCAVAAKDGRCVVGHILSMPPFGSARAIGCGNCDIVIFD
jgi:hypothetical protein